MTGKSLVAITCGICGRNFRVHRSDDLEEMAELAAHHNNPTLNNGIGFGYNNQKQLRWSEVEENTGTFPKRQEPQPWMDNKYEDFASGARPEKSNLVESYVVTADNMDICPACCIEIAINTLTGKKAAFIHEQDRLCKVASKIVPPLTEPV